MNILIILFLGYLTGVFVSLWRYLLKPCETKKKGCRCCQDMTYILVFIVSFLWPIEVYAKLFPSPPDRNHCSGMLMEEEENKTL